MHNKTVYASLKSNNSSAVSDKAAEMQGYS